MSVVQVFLGRPWDLLACIFPFISCSCDELCLIRCPRYCNFLILNCLTISWPVPILLNTPSLVIFSVHDIFNTLRSIKNNMDGKDYQRGSIEKDGNRQRNSETIQDEEITISRTSYKT